MSKGFIEYNRTELEDMIFDAYEGTNDSIYQAEVRAFNTFMIVIKIRNKNGEHTFGYDALSDFNIYEGEFTSEDIARTQELFNSIVEGASQELEVL